MKNFLKTIGIIAFAALIALSFASCGDGTTDGEPITTVNSSNYAWSSGANQYDLTIIENASRAAVTSGDYVLVIRSSSVNYHVGKATSTDGKNITLSNDGGSPFTITITDTTVTVSSGATVAGNTVSGGDKTSPVISNVSGTYGSSYSGVTTVTITGSNFTATNVFSGNSVTYTGTFTLSGSVGIAVVRTVSSKGNVTSYYRVGDKFLVLFKNANTFTGIDEDGYFVGDYTK